MLVLQEVKVVIIFIKQCLNNKQNKKSLDRIIEKILACSQEGDRNA